MMQVEWVESCGEMMPAWKPHEWQQLVTGVYKCRTLCPAFVVRYLPIPSFAAAYLLAIPSFAAAYLLSV